MLGTFEDAFKAIVGPDTFETYGRLNPEQANEFIDFMTDDQVVLKMCDVQKMQGTEKNLDILGIGTRVLRKRVAGQEGTGISVTPTQKQLRTVGTKLTAEVSYDTLKVNIAKEDLLTHFMKLCATQIGNDVEDLGFNGDITSADDFLNINDGWLKHALDGNIYDTNASVDYLGVVFPGMLAKLPAKYRVRRDELAFMVHPDVLDAYVKQLGALGGQAYEMVIRGLEQPKYANIEIVGAPYTSSVKHILTQKKNLVHGVNTEGIMVEMGRDIKKQTIISVFSIDLDYKVLNDASLVLGYNA